MIQLEQTTTKDIYTSKDGINFNDKESCVRHEKLLDLKKEMENIPVCYSNQTWYFVRNEDDFKLLVDYIKTSHDCTLLLNTPYGYNMENTWVTYEIEDLNDYSDELNIISFIDIQDDFFKLKNTLENYKNN